mgnify:CR=1 FL=1
MQIYLEQLLYNLATYSDLEDPRLELVIVKNPSMNAFAVPGGVVGFHTGVFAYAENEDQMASVLAHELAHLSQRHFSRGAEAQKKTSVLSMAGLLASVVLAATAGGDAATAAMVTTQALARLHRAFSKSISSQVAPRTSPLLAAVRMRKRRASAETVWMADNSVRKDGRSSKANAGW